MQDVALSHGCQEFFYIGSSLFPGDVIMAGQHLNGLFCSKVLVRQLFPKQVGRTIERDYLGHVHLASALVHHDVFACNGTHFIFGVETHSVFNLIVQATKLLL